MSTQAYKLDENRECDFSVTLTGAQILIIMDGLHRAITALREIDEADEIMAIKAALDAAIPVR